MPLAIINLTLLVPTEEVENFLEGCSEYVSQTALPLPEIRQKLIDYVTTRCCGRYTIINHTEESPGKFDFPYGPLEQRLRVEILIHEGILHILTENASQSGNVVTECIYYFGHFTSVQEAEFAQQGYIEDLEQESAQGIDVTIKRCRPKKLTIFEDDLIGNSTSSVQMVDEVRG